MNESIISEVNHILEISFSITKWTKEKNLFTGAVRIFLKKRSNKSKGRKNVWHGNWHVWNAKCKCLPYCCYMTNLEICGLPHTVEICDCLFSSNATTAADDMKNLHKTPPGWTSQPIFGHQMFCYFFLLMNFFYFDE